MSQMEQNRAFAAQFEAVGDEKLSNANGGFYVPVRFNPIISQKRATKTINDVVDWLHGFWDGL